MKHLVLTLLAFFLCFACGDDEKQTDTLGIASQCTKDADCPKVGNFQLTCLTAFKGGYCGLSGCANDPDCPTGTACVAVGTTNYCFRECTEKPECNHNRTVDFEANCVGNADHVGTSTSKVCVPPSGS